MVTGLPFAPDVPDPIAVPPTPPSRKLTVMNASAPEAVRVTTWPTLDGLGVDVRVNPCPEANPAEQHSSASAWIVCRVCSFKSVNYRRMCRETQANVFQSRPQTL